MKINSVLIDLFFLVSAITPATAETFLYRGELELISISGKDCADTKQGSRIPIEVALKREKNGSGERIDGYYSGPGMEMGHFSGTALDTLHVVNSSEIMLAPQEHNLALRSEGDGLAGELHEKTVMDHEPGCSFSLGKLYLKKDGEDKQPDSGYLSLSRQFGAESESHLGTRLFLDGRIAESRPHFETALRFWEEKDGNNSTQLFDQLVFLAGATAWLGQHDESFALLERAMQLPADAVKKEENRQFAIMLLCGTMAKAVDEDKGTEVMGYIARLRSRFPDSLLPLITQAEALIETGMTEEGCQLLEAELPKHPDDPLLKKTLAHGLYHLGWEFFDTDDPDKSLAQFLRALDLDPGNPEIFSGIVTWYSKRGIPGEAHKVVQGKKAAMVNELGPAAFDSIEAYIYHEEARLAEKNAQYPQAEELYRRAISMDPSSHMHVIGLAGLLHKTGHYTEAVKLLEEQLKICQNEQCRNAIVETQKKQALLQKVLKRL
jgi:tetratricopeptide (TPR) repeat protein